MDNFTYNREGLTLMTVYFDNASTTQVRDDVVHAMTSALRETYGNPSSTHTMGRAAKSMLDDARQTVASALGATPEEVYFTSGGTEADNWALLGAAEALPKNRRHMITSSAEHAAVLKSAEALEKFGWRVTYLTPDENGRITLQSFADALTDETAFASLMLVSNETGAVNPIGEMVRETKRRRLDVLFHTDAVQGFMKLPFTVKSLGVGLMTVSGHKIHGPKGVGALYAAKGVRLRPMLYGGTQERSKRPGTEAMPAIAGFSEAVRGAVGSRGAALEVVRALYEQAADELRVKVPGARVLSPGDSPYILSISLPGYKSEVLMNCLEADGICVSKSSACKKGARSHVLEAMNLPNDVIDGALRIGFSRYSTAAEVSYFIDKLAEAAGRLRRAR